MKTVREVEIKLFPTHLDAIMDENFVLYTIDIEDEVFPEYLSLERNNLSETYRRKSFLRSGSFIEHIYLKQF